MEETRQLPARKVKRRHSVITKIILVYLLTAALPLMLAGVLYARYILEKAGVEMVESLGAQLAQAQQELDQLFSDAIAIGETISRTPSVITLIENDFSTSEMVTNLRYNVLPLIETVQSIRGMGNIQVIHGSEHISPVYNSVIYDPTYADTFQHEEHLLAAGFLYSIAVEPERIYFSDINRDDAPVFSVCYAIRPQNGLSTIGLVRIAMPVESILRGTFRTGDFAEADIAFLSQGAPIYDMPAGDDDAAGDRIVHLSQTSRRYGYEVRCAVPARVSVPSNVYLTVYAIGFALVSILAIGLIVAPIILKPLRKAAEAMEWFSAGNLGYRLAETGRDEVSMLAHTYNGMAERMELLLEELRAVQLAEKRAIYKSLVSQVRPHFLNNALDAVRMRAVVEGLPHIARHLEAIIHYLRYNIGNVDTFVTLEEEIASVTDYIAMHNLTTREEISFLLIADHEARASIAECRVPKFTLQPIVENCIRHGFHVERPKHVFLRIEPESDAVRICVEDNGIGIAPERLALLRESLAGDTPLAPDDAHASIGLYNILQRLRIYYPGGATLHVESFVGTGTSVTVVLPLQPPAERFM